MAANPDSPFYLQYAYEKLSGAIEILATSPESLRDRLIMAAREVTILKPDDFPEGDLRDSFCRLRSTITAKAAQGAEGRIQATLFRRRRRTLAKIAQQCFDLYTDVRVQREFVR